MMQSGIRKRYIKGFMVIPVALMIIAGSGCAGAKEVVKGIAGVSTKVLYDTRKDAVKRDVFYDLDSCTKKIEKILAATGSYIYSRDTKTHLIAIYISQTNTTPVGIFLTAANSSVTHIEISSPSTYGKEFIAERLFKELEKRDESGDKKDKPKESTDAKHS